MNFKPVEILSPTAFRALLSSSLPGSRVVPIDASWYLPNNPRNAKREFEEERIENALFFDLDLVKDDKSPYPHMLASYKDFLTHLNDLKISNRDTLVVYDKSGIFSSARVSWNFALYGHPKVYLLNSFVSYKDADYPLDTDNSQNIGFSSASAVYQSVAEEEIQREVANQVIAYDELLDLVSSGTLSKDYILLDARSNGRFTGSQPEPRPELSSGHIPNSLSLPFSLLLSKSGTYKSRGELIELFKDEFGIDFTQENPTNGKKFIVSCGTGVTAVIIRLAIESVIKSKVPIRVYDGSWTEWAQRAPKQYIIKGP